MNVIGIQLDIVWENKAANFAKVQRLMAAAQAPRDSIVVLPEMFATGFSMNTSVIAEPYGGETEQFLANTAKEFGVYVVGGAAMKARDGRVRNKALVFSPSGELVGFYAKMRPFTPGKEDQHYTPGDRVLAVRCGEIHVSPFICYDLRFPEIFRQAVVLRRPELFVVIASWPEKRAQHWLPMLQSRAIENQAYVIGINRVGKDPYYSYTGRSAIIDFDGGIVSDGGEDETMISARLDLAKLRQYRAGLPFLNDMSFEPTTKK